MTKQEEIASLLDQAIALIKETVAAVDDTDHLMTLCHLLTALMDIEKNYRP